MATLNLTPGEFGDIGMIWLFDQVMNPELVTNDRLKEFIEQHKSKIKTPLMKYYLDSDSETRLQYKRIKGIFSGKSKSIQQIRIGPEKDIKTIKKSKESLAKKIVKKILTKESLTLEDELILYEMIEGNFKMEETVC